MPEKKFAGEQEQKKRPFSLPLLSARTLKNTAAVSMVIDHIGVVLLSGSLPFGAAALADYSQLPAVYAAAPAYFICRLLGRLAFPLYAFLLVEGFFHTRSRRKYLLSLLVFALISEIPFDLAASGKIFNLASQNVFFTLAASLLMLMLVSEEERKGNSRRSGLIAFGCAALTFLLRTDYNVCGPVLILILYLFHDDPKRRFFASALVLLCFGGLDSFCAAASLIWLLYSGEPGKKGGKYFYYALYPAHLALLVLLRSLCV